jgi:hypothetical protein
LVVVPAAASTIDARVSPISPYSTKTTRSSLLLLLLLLLLGNSYSKTELSCCHSLLKTKTSAHMTPPPTTTNDPQHNAEENCGKKLQEIFSCSRMGRKKKTMGRRRKAK